MPERITNRNNIFSKEKEKDRPSCLILCCCIAAFFTAAICLLIGIVITCLKVFDNSYVDIFLPLNLIMLTFIGITTFYLSLGIGLILYDKGLRRQFKKLFKHILRNYLPQYAIERRYPVRESSGRTAARSNMPTKQEIELDTSNLPKIRNSKPKTMVDIVSQEQFDEIFKSLSDDNFVRNRVLRKAHPTASYRQRRLSPQLTETAKSEQFFPFILNSDLDLCDVNPISTNAPGKRYIHESAIQSKITPAKYEARDPKSSSVVWSQSTASQQGMNYVSLAIPPEIELYPLSCKKSLSIRKPENQAEYDQKISYL